MSDAVSPMNGATFEGFVTVSDTGPRGMITLRGAPEELARMAKALGPDLPEPLSMTAKGPVTLAWMSPDELMVLCDYDAAPGLAGKAEAAVAGAHALVAVVSDARAIYRLDGPDAADVLRKLTPARLDGAQVGTIRRTRLAQSAGAFWMTGPGLFEVMCFRSEGQYVWTLLCNAARPGSELNL
ncbi:sarcosine oxidase subunit gamma [Maritimibacter sp. DP07]|uniref:Sarcosine oxidase subunit gamma n=1 Tax=Maritimibacter harenae TaxID=2606218 RepID=A0A845M8H0_9RHOB|nr:sarcosine oxidase subunit gamma family protein [Maritimibacter harenae]MZR12984.1 sarcosine oxidase subunit gamma [Maritimibacter harenae]